MSVWESVGSTYVEAAAAALPLHRLVLFGGTFLGVFAVESRTHLSVLESVMRISLVDLMSMTAGPIPNASVAYLVIAVGIVLLGWAASRVLLWAVFSMAAKVTGLWERVKTAVLTSNVGPNMSLADRQTAAALLESSLRGTRHRLRALNAFAELTCGLAIALILVSYFGTAIDLFAGCSLLAVSLVLHVVAVRIFLAEYFGPALFKSRLQGRDPPTPLSMQ